MRAMLVALQTHLMEPNSSTLSRITVVAQQQDTFQTFRHCFKEWNQVNTDQTTTTTTTLMASLLYNEVHLFVFAAHIRQDARESRS